MTFDEWWVIFSNKSWTAEEAAREVWNHMQLDEDDRRDREYNDTWQELLVK